jgi:hypothetical protein
VPSTGVLTANAFTSTVPTGAAPLVVASTTTVANLGATNTLNTNVTEDVATTAPVYPTFVTGTTGNLPQRVASSRLSFIPSTGALTAGSFVGALSGNANTATTATNTTITNDIATAAVTYPTFVTGTTGNLPQHVASSRLSFIPSTGALTASSFVGALSGNANTATTATNTTITNDIATAAVTYPTFVTNTTGNLGQRTSSTGLNFVPSTGVLTANAFTSTVPTGAAPLVVASTTTVANLGATNALNTNVTEDVATTAPVYPTFVTGTTGNLPQRVASSRLSFVPSTGILTATGFVGSLTGNATTASTVTNTTITDDNTTAVPVYPTFVTNTTGDLGQRTAGSSLSFVPSTGVLTARGFTSTVPTGVAPLIVASTTTVANLSATNALNTNITDDVATGSLVYPTFVTATSGNQNQRTASSRLTFTPSNGVLTATGGFVGSLNGNATTATNAANAGISASSTITEDATSTPESYPVFVNLSPGNQPLRTITTAGRLSFQPSTGRLTAGRFAGPLTGNVTGNATSADDAVNTVNIRVNPSNLNTPMYPAFVSNTSGSLTPFTNSGLTFTPQSGELSAPVFRGALTGNASTATTVSGNVAAVNGGTGQSSYTTGDLLYANTSISLSKLSALGMGGRVLRVNTVTGLPTWELSGAGTVQSVNGTANKIIIANNDPTVSPTIDIAPTYVGQNSITTVGALSTGSLTTGFTAINPAQGGTGLATLPANVLIGNGIGAVTVPGGANNSGNVLTSQGPGLAPQWSLPVGTGDMLRAGTQTITGPKTFEDNTLILAAGTGTTVLRATANLNSTVVIPAGNSTLLTANANQTIAGNNTFTGDNSFAGTTTLGVTTASSITIAGTTLNNLNAASVVSGGIDASNASDATNGTIVRRNNAGNFTAGTITASLAGNASTASFAAVATLATNATNSAVTNTTTSTTFYPTFVANTSGYEPIRASNTNFNFNPSTGVLTATGFIGALNGNATTVTTVPALTGAITTNGTTNVTYVGSQTGTGSTFVMAAGNPAFSGSPTAPTAPPGTNTTQLATTAFVLANSGMLKFLGVAATAAPPIAGGTEDEVNYPAALAPTNGVVVVSPIAALQPGMGIMSARVSAAGIVTVRYRNFSDALLTPNVALNITVIQ